jgi:MFS family permease
MCVTTAAADRPEVSAFAPLLLAAALAGSALGLFNPLIAAQLMAAGHDKVAIGANSTLFFLCILLSAPLAAWLIGRLGLRRVLALGMVLTALAAAPFPWTQGLATWSVLRALMGVGLGLYMIAGQSTLNTLASERHRAAMSGGYALCFGLGMGLGPLLGAQLYTIAPELAFGAGAVLLLCGLPWVLRALPATRVATATPRMALLRRLSLPLHSVFAYGAAEATLMTLYPVFMLERGQTLGELSIAFGAFIVGGLLATLPVTRCADRFGCERVLLTCAALGVLSSLGLIGASGLAAITTCAVLMGASLGPMFALALAMVGSTLSREELPAGSALFTTAFSLGCILAPFITGVLMQALGPQHVFSLTLLLLLGLLVRLIKAPAPVSVGTRL